jgi:hypothetical protein
MKGDYKNNNHGDIIKIIKGLIVETLFVCFTDQNQLNSQTSG